MKKRRLKNKITLLVMGAFLLTFAVATLYFTRRDEALVINQNQRLYRHLTESLAISITNALLYQELEFLEEGGLIENYIEEWMNDEELFVRSIRVVDLKNNIIASNNLREYGKKFRHNNDNSHETLGTYVTEVKGENGEPLLEVFTSLNISTRSWGMLQVKYSLRPLKKELTRVRFEYTLVLIPLATIILIVLGIYLKRAFKPLEDLREFADGVPEASWFRAPVSSNDEIGEMAKTFNQMLDELEQVRQFERETQEKFHHAERVALIGRLAAGVAHEIRNPIAGIENLIVNLKRYKDNEEKYDQYVDAITNGLHRIEKIVAGLLSLSHQMPFTPQRTNVFEILEDTIELISYNLRKEKILVKWDVSIEDSIIWADGDQLRQVFLNISINAINSMKNGGEITFGISSGSEEFLDIYIEDKGEGIATDKIKLIFDPFYTTQPPGVGTGLGLAVTKSIIERHGGTISVASQEGVGTRFTMRLPRTLPEKEGYRS